MHTVTILMELLVYCDVGYFFLPPIGISYDTNSNYFLLFQVFLLTAFYGKP